MFGFLSFLFIFIFAFFVIILSIAAKVVGGIFRTGKRMTEKMTSSSSAEEEQPRQSRSSYQPHPQKKKIFDSDEGEYIDFEEIKD